MNANLKFALAALLAAGASTLWAQGGRGNIPAGPVQTDKFHTMYIRLGQGDEGLLFEPNTPGPNARIALVYAHPDGNNFNFMGNVELAKRGYRTMGVNHHGDAEVESLAVSISRAITYLRTIPGVQKVLVMGHSGGGHLMGFYGNVSLNGAPACNGPEKVFPCDGQKVANLAKPDGVVLLDTTLGAFHEMSALDPAVEGDKRVAALDMFVAANGYDPATKSAKYSPEFAKKFHAAQSARNKEVVDAAVARMNAIKAGKAPFTDDEPLLIKGMGVNAAGARLYQPDTAFVSHTKKPHTLLKADGTKPEVIVNSVRPPSGGQFATALNVMHTMSMDTTVRDFLRHSAVRTNADFAFTADDIIGVDWKSAFSSTPSNAEGITVPTLVQANSCHYLIVPDEIIYDHLAAKDKTLAFVEGAVHGFTPCKPEYGDTVKRAFDNVDAWLSKPGRF
jgi:hypothetical protein